MRPIRVGSISFGFVSVPVRMFPATESRELGFHFLHKRRESIEWTKKHCEASSKRQAS